MPVSKAGGLWQWIHPAKCLVSTSLVLRKAAWLLLSPTPRKSLFCVQHQPFKACQCRLPSIQERLLKPLVNKQKKEGRLGPSQGSTTDSVVSCHASQSIKDTVGEGCAMSVNTYLVSFSQKLQQKSGAEREGKTTKGLNL